jgi:EF hand
MRFEKTVVWAFASALFVAGCSTGPKPLVLPSITASSAAKEAMALADKDGDGSLTKEELKALPSILNTMAKYDANGDGKVDATELESRIAAWSAKRGLGATNFYVLMDGRPFVGAKVVLEPEPIFDDELAPAESGVSPSGTCSPTLAPERLTKEIKTGIYLGLYKVKVTHPDKSVPARYNEQTELGIEIAPDYDIYNPIKFRLTSK